MHLKSMMENVSILGPKMFNFGTILGSPPDPKKHQNHHPRPVLYWGVLKRAELTKRNFTRPRTLSVNRAEATSIFSFAWPPWAPLGSPQPLENL